MIPKTDRHVGIDKRTMAARVPKPDKDDWIDAAAEDVLTCPVPAFERQMAQQYQDWNEFTNWMEQQHEHSTGRPQGHREG